MSISDQNTLYYHCPRCRQWVPATRSRCTCGQFLSGLMPQAKPEQEPVRQRQEQAAIGSIEAPSGKTAKSKGAPCMRCTGCGKILWTFSRSCPSCQGILQVLKEEEASYPSYEEFEDESPAYARTMAIGWDEEEEEEEEQPLFYFNAVRYDNGYPIKAQTLNLPIYSEGLMLGRILFTTDARLFFPKGSRAIDARYAGISRYNAVLKMQEGELVLKYCQDGSPKSPVYVNQVRLEPEESHKIRHGDVIRFGSKKKSDGTIDVHILAAGREEEVGDAFGVREGTALKRLMEDLVEEMRQNAETTHQGIEKVNEGIDKVSQGIKEIQGDLQVINRAIGEINPSELHIRRDEDAAAYESRLSASVPEVTAAAREEYVCRYLASVLEKDSRKYQALTSFFQEKERRFHLLYQAAFFEDVCETIGLEDYAGPMSFLGKAIEGFVMGEVAEVVKTFNREEYEALEPSKRKRLNQNDILQLCGKDGNAGRILKNAGYDINGRDRAMQGCLEQALQVLHKVRIARNEASHCSPDTEMPADEPVEAITRERYHQVKARLFQSNTIEIMHMLYMRTRNR